MFHFVYIVPQPVYVQAYFMSNKFKHLTCNYFKIFFYIHHISILRRLLCISINIWRNNVHFSAPPNSLQKRLSVRQSVRTSFCQFFHIYQRGLYWKDFHEIWHCRILWKSAEKSQILSKSNKNMGTLREYPSVFHNWASVNVAHQKKSRYFLSIIMFSLFLKLLKRHKYFNNTRVIQFCVSMATIVTWKPRNNTLYIHCLSW